MKTKSIWGNPPKRLYNLMKIAEQDKGNNFTACIVGCSDGKFLMPFARKEISVTGYDIDNVALYGGYKDFPIINEKLKLKYIKTFKSQKYGLESRYVYGIVERLEKEKIRQFANIEKLDFYKADLNVKFDVVFTSCSLHYSVNKDFTLKEKTEKLQSIVNNGGLLYMDYMMAIDETDYESYPSNKFYRKGEILDYFNTKEWVIISYRENTHPSFEGAHVDCVVDHFHRFGYLLAKRK